MGIEELKIEALRLSQEGRAYLAKELLDSLDTRNELEIEVLWANEAVRRDDELDSGAAQAYPAKEVLAHALSRRK